MYAEQLALSLSDNPIYMATAHIWDEEFKERVNRHRERRGANWTNIEEEKYLSRHYIYNKVCVIDCITLWCTNFFYDKDRKVGEQPGVDEALEAIKREFDNEIGSGGVSDNAIQRSFTDLEGWMNQYVAAKADEVILMVAGIPVKIK